MTPIARAAKTYTISELATESLGLPSPLRLRRVALRRLILVADDESTFWR